ncbi:MAG: EthD family reductase [Gemmatimonadales bacterium]|nr:EthD family reductase [Gemmatimonadales bacterium]
MPAAKIVVLYPRPTDVSVFERVYMDEHIPLARARISGATRFVFARVQGAVGGEAPYHRVTEIHFASMESLQASAATPGTQEAAGHAIEISTGGPPVFLITDEETMTLG